MEWKIFEERLDIPLYRQMEELVYLTSTKEDKYQRRQENERYALFGESTEKTMEEAYGLHYPGEVLERLWERREVTAKELKALGFALAKTKNLQEEGLFIGNQLPVFLKKLYALPEDAFLLGIRYLLEEREKKQFYEALFSYPYEEIAEILFVLSILPEDDDFWETVKKKLNAKLGTDREISVYENSGVYQYLVQNFQFRMKGYRKKDLDVLKYLMRLPFGSICGSGRLAGEKLMENGYASEEAAYLNYFLIRETNLPGRIDTDSITAEKLAIEVCRQFLSAEREYPDLAYELCSQLCAAYHSFEVKVQGFAGITDVLAEEIEVKNVKAFQVLYPYSDKSGKEHWKRLRLTDSKWDVLYSVLEKKKYDECVLETLEWETDGKKLAESLTHYRELTGTDYRKRFWEQEHWKQLTVFRHLAEPGLIPVTGLMEQFLAEYQMDEKTAVDKWKNMLYYLYSYMKGIQSQESYAMLECYVKEMGIRDIANAFSVTELLEGCFKNIYSNYSRYCELDLFRPFLEPEEHRHFFTWLDDYVFQNYTEYYQSFVFHILSREENLLWFPKEEAQAVYSGLREKLGDQKMPSILRKIYMTEEEQQKLKDMEELLEERRALKKQLDKIRDMKAAFSKMIAGSRKKAGQFLKILAFVNYSDLEEAEDSAVSYLRSLFRRGQVYLYNAEDMGELTGLLSKLYACGKLELKEEKKFVNEVEEMQNEGTDIKAPTDGQQHEGSQTPV